MTDRHKQQLVRIGLLVAGGIPAVLAVWIVIARLTGLDVYATCRLAGMSSLALLATGIFLPLLLDVPREARWRGFVVVWFAMSAGFNLVWELPLVVFRSALAHVEVSVANLPIGIAWWGYTLSDSDYRTVTPFVVTIELTWLIANAIAVAGLWRLRRGDDQRAFLWMGIAGALQAYNASLYIVGNGVMSHFGNIAPGFMSQLLYWGFNVLWAGAATLGSTAAFRLALGDGQGQGMKRLGTSAR
jgi:hypothetical protein